MKFIGPTIAMIAAGLLTACTPGGDSPSALSGGPIASNIVTIDINLTLHPPTSTIFGTAGGDQPAVAMVPVGSAVRFVNSDGFAHTATLIPNATTFPLGSPFSISAQHSSGSMISAPWSSGALQAGSSSQTILVDKPGTYLWGCFFHYGAPMRGAIVAQ
ncbi:MAG: cupredoxin domain-containing protein [Vulcanimicrobiaceae bacterium]